MPERDPSWPPIHLLREAMTQTALAHAATRPCRGADDEEVLGAPLAREALDLEPAAGGGKYVTQPLMKCTVSHAMAV